MAKNPKLPKHVVERGGVLQYYRRIPTDLLEHPDWRGKKFVRVSLRTGDLKTAATESGLINADFERRFRESRAELKGSGSVMPMMPDLEDAAAVAFIIDCLTSLSGRMTWSGRGGHPNFTTPTPERVFDFHAGERGYRIGDGMRHRLNRMLADRLKRPGLDPTFDSRYAQLRHGLQLSCAPDGTNPPHVLEVPATFDRLISGVCEIVAPAMLPGLPYPVGAPLAAATASGHGVRSRSTLKGLIDRFSNDTSRGGDAAEYEPVFEIILDLIGAERVVDTITPEDIERVRDVISYLPPYATNATRFPEWKGMSRAAIADDVKKRRGDGERITLLKQSAVNKYLGQIGTLFRYAENKGMHYKSPVPSDIKLRKPRQKEDRSTRAAFPIQKLQLIFPVGFGGFMTDVKWHLAIALYQGFRGSEISQLMVDDIVQKHNIWCFRIDIDVWDEEGNHKTSDKVAKTEATKRLVPIHKKILDLGFIKTHVAQRRRFGKTQVFDTTKWGDKNYYESIRGKITEYIKERGAYQRGLNVFHSLRHNFSAACDDAGIPPLYSNQLGGWGTGDGTARSIYRGQTDVRKLKGYIDMVSYPLDI
ncbi:DUF6538 domain-containing protein [Azospirillum brasilense]|uniref:DUF6538 domain-containing protein n=1 Tax=Azospirillum brasilense TaxID=192 RepID=UPI00157B3B06|nr:DUF6538 domain-containing protein [Azospirillum brasilense]